MVFPQQHTNLTAAHILHAQKNSTRKGNSSTCPIPRPTAPKNLLHRDRCDRLKKVAVSLSSCVVCRAEDAGGVMSRLMESRLLQLLMGVSALLAALSGLGHILALRACARCFARWPMGGWCVGV